MCEDPVALRTLLHIIQSTVVSFSQDILESPESISSIFYLVNVADRFQFIALLRPCAASWAETLAFVIAEDALETAGYDVTKDEMGTLQLCCTLFHLGHRGRFDTAMNRLVMICPPRSERVRQILPEGAQRALYDFRTAQLLVTNRVNRSTRAHKEVKNP